MAWILVPCLVSLRGEFNALAPSRDKGAEGSIGDAAHAAEPSDHNPDETGTPERYDADNIDEVHAIDVDADLRKPSWTMQKAVDIIVARHRTGADNRLEYVIYNRRIASISSRWAWVTYDGSNPHTDHAHFSSRYTSAQESDTRPWGLLQSLENTVSQADVIAALKSAEGRELLADAVWSKKYGTDSTARRWANREQAMSSYVMLAAIHAYDAAGGLAAEAAFRTELRQAIADIDADPDVPVQIPAETAAALADQLAARLSAGLAKAVNDDAAQRMQS